MPRLSEREEDAVRDFVYDEIKLKRKEIRLSQDQCKEVERRVVRYVRDDARAPFPLCPPFAPSPPFADTSTCRYRHADLREN